jgi:hypothetical protein
MLLMNEKYEWFRKVRWFMPLSLTDVFLSRSISWGEAAGELVG